MSPFMSFFSADSNNTNTARRSRNTTTGERSSIVTTSNIANSSSSSFGSIRNSDGSHGPEFFVGDDVDASVCLLLHVAMPVLSLTISVATFLVVPIVAVIDSSLGDFILIAIVIIITFILIFRHRLRLLLPHLLLLLLLPPPLPHPPVTNPGEQLAMWFCGRFVITVIRDRNGVVLPMRTGGGLVRVELAKAKVAVESPIAWVVANVGLDAKGLARWGVEAKVACPDAIGVPQVNARLIS
mmetsp:Transcript_5869/g.11644  ORF Transcript_5869/g.11644 Transcript_5869/m.11644 type:complete len:240 (-) Transcript_5869:39-758(-)